MGRRHAVAAAGGGSRVLGALANSGTGRLYFASHVLQDGNVLTYDLFQSIDTNGAYAEAYGPSTGTWSSRSPSDGSSAASRS